MKKGFTIVELLVSFSLLSVVALLLFEVIRSSNTIYFKTKDDNDLLLKQSQIAYTLNTNFQEKQPTKITSCGNLCINIEYLNNDVDTLQIDTLNNQIILNKEKYEFSKDVKITHIYSDIQIFDVTTKLDSILNIFIGLNHQKQNRDYNINIIYTFNHNEFKDLNYIDFTS